MLCQYVKNIALNGQFTVNFVFNKLEQVILQLIFLRGLIKQLFGHRICKLIHTNTFFISALLSKLSFFIANDSLDLFFFCNKHCFNLYKRSLSGHQNQSG